MQSLITATQISLVVAHKILLEKISFDIKTCEIVGIVGRNGSGKSSLLKLIAGFNELDGGKMQIKNGLKIGYLAQEFELEENATIWQTLAKSFLESNEKNLLENTLSDSKKSDKNQIEIQNQSLKLENSSKLESETPKLNLQTETPNTLESQKNNSKLSPEIEEKISETLSELGFESTQIVKNLSGGEKRKLALSQILLAEPDLLILDEPTNHLDIEAIELLEKTLKNYIKNGNRSVLLVSHDRFFLDKLATRMLEICGGLIYSHSGNYQNYLENKKIRLEINAITEYRKQGFLRKELVWVRAGVKARATKDKGRMDRFEEIKNSKKFENEVEMEMLLPKIRPLGNKIINLEEVVLEISEIKNGSEILKSKKIIQNLTFDFDSKTVLGLIGPNGSGKTTLIKAILGRQKIQSGKIIIGDNTVFNYQDQHKWNLNLENTIFEEIANSQESLNFGDSTVNSRSYLRKLGFDNNQILIQIKNLSGGQRARVILAKILIKGGNCLILDEPTNDLDLETIELLEKSILDFEGVCIIVSHDRYFLNQVCNQILSLEGNGNFLLSTGNWDDFVRKNQKTSQKTQETKLEKTLENYQNNKYKFEENKTTKLDYHNQKQQEKDLKKCESQIQKLESQVQILENQMEKEFQNPNFYQNPKYQKSLESLENTKAELAKLLELWETLN